MAVEIERKFLVKNDGWRGQVRRSVVYRQGYLAPLERCSVRVRVSDESAFLNIKSATLGIERQEYEYPIPLEDANRMLDDFCEGRRLEKTRHYVDVDGRTWEVDEFHGDNAGLIVAEVELQSVHEVVALPAWAGEEVSDDPRYYNVRLVTHPYRMWTSR